MPNLALFSGIAIHAQVNPDKHHGITPSQRAMPDGQHARFS